MTSDKASDLTMTASAVFDDDVEHLCLRVVGSPDGRLEPGPQVLVEKRLVVSREETGRDAPLSKGRFGVVDGRISRKHARISPGQQCELTVEDLDSKNGTWVNGCRVTRAIMRRGDVLRVGDTLLVYCPMAAPGSGDDRGMGLVGRSRAVGEVRRVIRQVAGEELSILITGETGTGKELVASAIHERSGRKGPIIAVNSSAIPSTLFESELFGCKKGAFSGATEDRKGLIREAHGGTLFLDEIGEMSGEVQAKLLRCIEHREVTSVGAGRSIPVDVRFLAATNVQLGDRARDGDFREDLLHRLGQFPIVVPPLRDRREDIVLLWQHFAAVLGFAEHALEDANTLEALLVYNWPGNVRELRNAASQQCVRMREPEASPVRALPREVLVAYKRAREGGTGAANGEEPAAEPGSGGYRYVSPRTARPTRDVLLEALARHDNSIAAVAREFGCHRQQIYRWMESCGIDR